MIERKKNKVDKSTFKFDKKNGMHLFSVFILLGACVFSMVSLFFVQKQAEDTARLIVEESNAGRFSTIENYTKEFLNSHQQTLTKMVEHPLVRASTLQGVADKIAFEDQIAKLKVTEVSSYFSVYDFIGNEIYSESILPENVANYIKSGVRDESLLTSVSYSFFKKNSVRYIMLSAPILYNGLAEGLGVYISTVDENRLRLGLSDDGNYWVGITQDRLGWKMIAPTGWETQTSEIPEKALSVSFALSPSLFSHAQQSLFNSLFVGLLVATTVAFSALFFLGRRVLVSPYQQLYRSEQELIVYSEALKRKEEESALLARVAKHMRDAVIFTDTETKITWVNDAFEKMTGYAFEEAVGKRPGELLQGEDTDRETTLKIRKAIQNRESAFFEVINYTKQGKLYWVEVALTPLYNKAGELESFMGVERDVTQRVDLETSLRQKVLEAEAANIAKSQFLAAMSHELRTPMNGVLGMGELLKSTQLSVTQQGHVDTLLQSGSHMISVLNDILDYSKIEAGKLDISSHNFSLMSAVDKVVHMYEPLCREKGLNFVQQTPSHNDEIMICSDEKRLVQILQNLLGNAYKFTLKGDIKFELKIVDNGVNNKTLSIAVTDTGIGIAKEKLGDVFEAFVQADSNSTRNFGGTGLGLAICKEIAHEMGGHIHVDSELGIGSRFSVDLPVTLVQSEGHVYMVETPMFTGSGLSALIVEDNRVNTILLSKLLELRGFEYDTAENGQIAVEKTKAGHFDCLFMDNHMPVMDGIESTTVIKNLKLDKEPVVFGCTADVFEETRLEMLAAGCVEVLTKPISLEKLDEALHHWLKPNRIPSSSSKVS
ncbi:ATP-binding protein [Vibrio sp. YMD68]|uniref:PAS domain-containing hybrid sensor histidine kinase/response regulator n=1 Tax=Vibrio sp. YMD68 TaxID=3042300 RepID=UPI00249BC87D|nr:ATP-binding protein [Vibrio sp. YMD68]WGV99249.1 ATP-binding protein [Vibrio sp. YMD68]